MKSQYFDQMKIENFRRLSHNNQQLSQSITIAKEILHYFYKVVRNTQSCKVYKTHLSKTNIRYQHVNVLMTDNFLYTEVLTKTFI